MLWVAEVGSAHKGSKALAYEFIRRFSEAGAHVLKFQFGWTKEAQEAMGLEYNPVRHIDTWAGELQLWCNYFNVELMASIWSEEGLQTAQDVDMRSYKVGYQLALKNKPLMRKILGLGRTTYVSGRNLFCVSKYPTYPWDLQEMPSKFDTFFGYSDHTHGIEACLLAVARGARYIEKHVCLGKDDLTVKDTPFSATPEEFAEMVRIGNGMRRLLDAGV